MTLERQMVSGGPLVGVFDAAPIGMGQIDANGRLTDLNAEFARLIGVRAHDALHRPLAEIAPACHDRWLGIIRAIRANPGLSRETVEIGVPPDGKSLEVVGWASKGPGRTPSVTLLVSEVSADRGSPSMIGSIERARFAREIHDGLAQDLWLAKLTASKLARHPTMDADGRALCADLLRSIDAGLTEARTAVMAMRSVNKPTVTLSELLERQVNEFSDRFGIRAATANVLRVRLNVAGAQSQPVDLGSTYLNAPHRYRIEWDAAQIRFLVDGTLVHTSATISANLRPIASDYNTGGGSLSIDLLRMTPYAASGSFTSRVLDAGAADWTSLSWTATEPTGTGLAMSYRTGDTATPDGSWTAFAPVASSGGALAGSSRYIQYRATLTSSDPAVSPTLNEIILAYVATTLPPGGTPGDYDGDGDADMAVYRPSDGTWYIRDGTSTDWGVDTDIPVPADYDGDGSTDLAVWRPGSGQDQGYWYIQGQPSHQWGISTDIPVPADYDGDGTTDLAVFRPADGVWYVRTGTSAQWGTAGDIPLSLPSAIYREYYP